MGGIRGRSLTTRDCGRLAPMFARAKAAAASAAMAAKHASIVFSKVLTPEQIASYDTIQQASVPSVAAPIKTWIKSGELQQAMNYFEAQKYRFFEDTPQIRDLSKIMEKIRKMVHHSSQA